MHGIAALAQGYVAGHVSDAAENYNFSIVIMRTAALEALASAGAVEIHEVMWCMCECLSCCGPSLNHSSFGRGHEIEGTPRPSGASKSAERLTATRF